MQATFLKMNGLDHKYEISIQTGNGFDAGTSVNVGVKLYGSKCHSTSKHLTKAITVNQNKLSSFSHLFGKMYPSAFKRGQVDVFAVASYEDLGDIERIKLWHDNTGLDPGWFCSKVIVKNKKTNKRFYFIVDSWLHISPHDETSSVEKLVYGTQENEIFEDSFKNLLDKAKQYTWRDQHLWLSIVDKPTMSSFTRVQRLLVAYSSLMIYMLFTCVWYQSPYEGVDADLSPNEFKILGIPLLWTDIIVAVVATCCTSPFSVLLAVLFRSLKSKSDSSIIPLTSITKMRSQKFNSKFNEKAGNTRPGSTQSLEIDIQLAKSGNNFGGLGNVINSGNRVSSRGIPEMADAAAPSFGSSVCLKQTATQLRRRSRSFLNDIEKLKSIDEKEKKVNEEAGSDSGVQLTNNSNSRSSYIEKEQSMASTLPSIREDEEYYNQSNFDFQENIHYQDGNFDGYSDGNSMYNPSDANFNKPSKGCLPYWIGYLAFFLVVLICSTCAFFIILYGQAFGLSRAKRWAVTFHVSLIFSFFFLEPIKIIVFSMMIAVTRAWRREYIIPSKNSEQSILGDLLASSREEKTNPIFTGRMIKPPQGFSASMAKKTAYRSHRWSKLVNRGIQHFALLVIVFIIEYSFVDQTEKYWLDFLEHSVDTVGSVIDEDFSQTVQIMPWVESNQTVDRQSYNNSENGNNYFIFGFDENLVYKSSQKISSKYSTFVNRFMIAHVEFKNDRFSRSILTTSSTFRPSRGVTVINLLFGLVAIYTVAYFVKFLTAVQFKFKIKKINLNNTDVSNGFNTKSNNHFKIIYRFIVFCLLVTWQVLYIISQVELENAYKNHEIGETKFIDAIESIDRVRISGAIVLSVLLLRCLSVFRLFKTTFVILQTMKSQLKILVHGMGWLFLVLFMAFYSSYYVLKIEPGHNTGMSMANRSTLDNTEPDEVVNSSPAKFFNLLYLTFFYAIVYSVSKVTVIREYRIHNRNIKHFRHCREYDHALPGFVLKRVLQRLGIKQQKRYRHTVKFEGMMTPLSRASSFYGGGGGYGFEDVDGMTSYFGESTLGASFLDSSMATGATGSNKNSQATKNTQTTKNSKTTSDNKTVHTYSHSANSSSYYGDGTSITTDLKSLDVSIHEINDQNQSNNVSGSEPRYLSDKPLDTLHVEYLLENVQGYQMDMLNSKIHRIDELTRDISNLEEKLMRILKTKESISEQSKLEQSNTSSSLSFKSKTSLVRSRQESENETNSSQYGKNIDLL